MKNVGHDSHVHTGVHSGGMGLGSGSSGHLAVGSGGVKLADADLYTGPRSQPKVQDPAKRAQNKVAHVETPAGPKNAVTFAGDQAVLLFNSDCPVCQKIAGWVIANDDPNNGGSQRLDERPIGYDPEALKKLNPSLTIWDAYSTIHVVMPDGSMKVGGEAIAEVLRRLPDTNWATGLLDVSIGGWRPFQSMLNTGYRILDQLRPALGCKSCGTPTPWWGKPIEWAVNAYKWITGASKNEPATTTPVSLNSGPKAD